jgi:hypothetical protein
MKNLFPNFFDKHLAAGFLSAAILIALLINGAHHGADFQVFYQAGARALSGLNLYQESDGWMVYKYHPAWAAFFSIFAPLPQAAAIVVFNVVMFGVWWIGVRIWASWLDYDIKNPTHRLLLLLLSLSAFSAETGFGQVNGILFLGLTMVASLLEGKQPRPLLAGILVTVLISLKLNFGLLFVYVLFKNLRSVFGIFLGVVILHFITASFFNNWLALDVYHNWIQLLLGQSSTQYYIFESQGLLRFFHSVFGENGKFLWLTTLLLFLYGGFRLSRKSFPNPAIPAGYWMGGIYLLSPLPWWYQILFMYPLIFFLFKTPLTAKERKILCFCLIVYAGVTFNTIGRNGIIWFKEWQGFFLCSLLIYCIFLKQVFVPSLRLRAPMAKRTT